LLPREDPARAAADLGPGTVERSASAGADGVRGALAQARQTGRSSPRKQWKQAQDEIRDARGSSPML
jgi:hypothetical protein